MVESSTKGNQAVGTDFPVDGECDATLYDSLSTYVATPDFLRAFEGRAGEEQQVREDKKTVPKK